MEPEKSIEAIHSAARQIIEVGGQTAYRAVNSSMLQTYRELGQLIVLEEQQGKARADYGKYIILELAKRLQQEYGTGFSKPSLWNYRQFYTEFPILSAVRRELTWTHCESQQLFASKYLLHLPSEAELKFELERERSLAEVSLQKKSEENE